MPASRPSRTVAVWIIGMALLLLFTVAMAACGGGADFEGTWVKPGEDGAMVIKKAGDGYDVIIKGKETDPDTSGFTLKGTMNGDTLELKDPTGASKDVVSITVSGDELTLKSGSETPEKLQRK